MEKLPMGGKKSWVTSAKPVSLGFQQPEENLEFVETDSPAPNSKRTRRVHIMVIYI